MFRSIWTKSLRDYRIPVLGWGCGLGLLMIVTLAAAVPAVREAYATIAVKFRFFSDAFAVETVEGYASARVLQITLPVLLSIWLILAGARMVRGEEERGTLDILLATPCSRRRIILEKLLALAVAVLCVALLIAVGIMIGEPLAHIEVNAGRALLTGLNLGLLAFFFAMVALLISQFTRSKGAAAGWTSGLMVLAFLLDGTGRTVAGTRVQFLSPFYYYNLNRPLIPRFINAPVGAVVLLGACFICAAASIGLFTRRDSGRPAITWSRQLDHSGRRIARSLTRAEADFSLRSVCLRALRAQAAGAFWWSLGIVVWCGWLVLLLPSLQEPFHTALTQSPNLAKLFGGGDVATNAGFLSVLVFGFVVVLVVVFALTVALSWASDLENGRLELVLSTPRSRSRTMLERFGAAALLVLLGPLLAWLGTIGGAKMAGLRVDQSQVLRASIGMVPPALVIIGLVYALAGRLRYGTVVGLVSAYIAVAFLIDFVRTLLQVPEWVLAVSIFHQYGSPITTGLNWGAFFAMTGIASVLLGCGLVQFRTLDVERG
ncbi:MAG: hypothetical protein NVS2B7_14890 [Herpetosiphon sp.]